MKKKFKIILLALALCVPVGMFGQNQSVAKEENPAHAELRQLRDGLLAAMNKGDVEATLGFLHTNVVITWHNAEVSRGHEGVRAYYKKVMTGPDRVIDSFNCSINVDELTMLYGSDMGICYGSSDEHFKLANGRNLDVKGRWTATLVRENGHWLVASLHCSTNLFDNVLLDFARKTARLVGILGLVAGLVIGWLVSRRFRRKA